MRMNRRDFYRLLLGAASAGLAPAAFGRAPRDIEIGASTFSFRDYSRNQAIVAMQELGIRRCELFCTHAYLPGDESPPKNWIRFLQEDAPQISRWRMTVGRDHFENIRQQFIAANMDLFLYYSGFSEGIGDDELEKEFLFANWLGVQALSTHCQPQSVKRLSDVAARHGVKLALHNTTSLFKRVRNLPSTAAEIEAQLKASPNILLNLDLGHFFAAGGDPIAFLKKNHRRVFNIQVKDRGRFEGPCVPCGEGDVPMADVMQLIRDRGWPISTTIEYEHDTEDIMSEMRRCLSEMRRDLA